MTTLFFLLAVLFMMYEISVIYNAKSRVKLIEELKNKQFWEEAEKDLKARGCIFLFMNILYLIWAVIGVALASQWHMFILLFSVGIIEKMMLKIVPVTEKSSVKIIDATISSLVLLWIFINHFHPGVLPDLYPF
jgi:hypothetical protein